MKRTEDKTPKKLPVTGEVGSEGGSFADPTLQVAEFDQEVGRSSPAAEPEQSDTRPDDAIKYPSE